MEKQFMAKHEQEVLEKLRMQLEEAQKAQKQAEKQVETK
jgi:hypothetical protein